MTDKKSKLTITFEGTSVRVCVNERPIGVIQDLMLHASAKSIFPSGSLTVYDYREGNAEQLRELLKPFPWMTINVLSLADTNTEPSEAEKPSAFESLRQIASELGASAAFRDDFRHRVASGAAVTDQAVRLSRLEAMLTDVVAWFDSDRKWVEGSELRARVYKALHPQSAPAAAPIPCASGGKEPKHG
jgi:hypothetical protein